MKSRSSLAIRNLDHNSLLDSIFGIAILHRISRIVIASSDEYLRLALCLAVCDIREYSAATVPIEALKRPLGIPIMRAPGYVRELDIVAVTPETRFAAFAMCWVEQASQVGQFEPVGTAPEYHRQGIARAVLVEGLQRMRQYGAKRVIVIVEVAEEAACTLYRSLGFETRWTLSWYTKANA